MRFTLQKYICSFLLLIGFLSFSFAQNTSNENFMQLPPFVNAEANYIHYAEQLKDFYQKLEKLKNGEIDRVNILHIGDSHLQGGYLTGELRRLLQNKFGNAGRGLIFPYQLVKTNAPFDIQSKSDIVWECSKNVSYQHNVPIGICGYSIRTSNPSFNVDIQLRHQEDHFDKITILNSQNEDKFELELWGNAEEGKLVSDKIPFKAGTCYLLNQPRTGLTVNGKKSDSEDGQYTLQGIILEKSKAKGILYNAVGVNGAGFYSYYRSANFLEQLQAMEPDLIIISLGTNEAAVNTLNGIELKNIISAFLNNLKEKSNCKSILMATPPDIYLRARYKTKNSMDIADIMHDLAKTKGSFAVWDFYEVMGGYGSVNDWFNSKLAAWDRIHYTIEGYQLQAQLLFQALMKEIKR